MQDNIDKVINELILIIKNNKVLSVELNKAIFKADLKEINDINDFLKFLNDKLYFYPQDKNILNNHEAIIFYIINQSYYLVNNIAFMDWLHKYTELYGKFMDSPDSVINLENFVGDPSFKINDYYKPASGWMSFNQFFARNIKPGKRIIDDLCNNNVIVSPVDGIFMGCYFIKNSVVFAKGVNFHLEELLHNSNHKKYFKNGIYMHMHLELHDYHHYHTPVQGKIIEINKIPGFVYLDVVKNFDGSLKVLEGEMVNINQDRGIIVLDTPNGLVAVICIGVGHISSVNMTPDLGDYLHKGQEFGYFAYGGSDVILLFQNTNIQIVAECKEKYIQGKKIAIYK
ncbi:phosphatidylserine decarboxylase [Tupanvirus deep ocean]|uniref:Phosphatidylserine decarboxylase n=2 Tax=Tupanvirus TaxID=2094720 RepID=A0AC62A8N9_9VIRU|nr:phosphatidylserine decarboxylase [Tupanvirus deep ocean]QKU34146.1 phosphatidylserine decarboxylase [Tupanvirus deep ocean]